MCGNVQLFEEGSFASAYEWRTRYETPGADFVGSAFTANAVTGLRPADRKLTCTGFRVFPQQ